MYYIIYIYIYMLFRMQARVHPCDFVDHTPPILATAQRPAAEGRGAGVANATRAMFSGATEG